MMKKALLRDSIKEIKNTYKRFISILVMAFLGVGFFAGLRAASPDMLDTIDKFYRDSQVFDIKIHYLYQHLQSQFLPTLFSFC